MVNHRDAWRRGGAAMFSVALLVGWPGDMAAQETTAEEVVMVFA